MARRDKIRFYTEGIEMPDINLEEIKDWIEGVALSYEKQLGPIDYIFVDDERILKINEEYLGHNYFTDIITFDYNEMNLISGDLYVSLDTVRSNAKEMNIPYKKELLRVIIHGILHLCGLNDKGPGEREIMEEAEDKAMKSLKREYEFEF